MAFLIIWPIYIYISYEDAHIMTVCIIQLILPFVDDIAHTFCVLIAICQPIKVRGEIVGAVSDTIQL